MKSNHDDPQPERGLVPLGDILGGMFAPGMLPSQAAPPKSKAKKTKATTPPSAKLQKAAAEIAARPSDTEAAYLARELVQCTLPHREPKTDFWVRRNGNFSLGLQAPRDFHTGETIGLPYGSIPRLILLWIVTEAIRTKSRTIKLGDTLNNFLLEIGLDPNTGGGKRSDAKRFKEQLTRLLRCHISFEYNDSKRQSWRDMPIGSEADLWWTEPDQPAIFESRIELGEKFFNAIIAAPVPVDLRALIPLKQSPLAIDLYTWATYRLHTMQRAGNPQIKIPLSDLKEQFGCEYKRLDHFKAAFVEALEKVREVFPALDYSFEKGALILRDSRKRPAIAPTDKTAAQRRLSELKPFDQVSETARETFKRDFPGWDADQAIADFYAWRTDKGQSSANSDRHFKAFARSWVQRSR